MQEAEPFSGTESPLKGKTWGGSPHGPPDKSQAPPNSCQSTSSCPTQVTTQATRGRRPLPCALSSLTEPGVQCWVLGSGAGRWGAAGAEGTAGQLHTAMRAPGCGTEGSAPHSPANLGRNFVYLQGTVGVGGKRAQEWSTPTSAPDQASLFLAPGPILAFRNVLQPWGVEGMPERVLARLRDLGSEARHPAPSPFHSELLTARAVQQFHDPKAVVQQGFGSHQLPAQPGGAQERHHRFHLGADLRVLEGARPVETVRTTGTTTPNTSEDAGPRPGEPWRLPHWELHEPQRKGLPVDRRLMGNFSPSSCRCQVSWEGPPQCPSPKPDTEVPVFHLWENDCGGPGAGRSGGASSPCLPRPGQHHTTWAGKTVLGIQRPTLPSMKETKDPHEGRIMRMPGCKTHGLRGSLAPSSGASLTVFKNSQHGVGGRRAQWGDQAGGQGCCRRH